MSKINIIKFIFCFFITGAPSSHSPWVSNSSAPLPYSAARFVPSVIWSDSYTPYDH